MCEVKIKGKCGGGEVREVTGKIVLTRGSYSVGCSLYPTQNTMVRDKKRVLIM